jgi:hypothetical protein
MEIFNDFLALVAYFCIWLFGGIFVITWGCAMVKLIEVLVKVFAL